MSAFNSLAILALVFFLAHVVLLFTSFGKSGYQKTRYFYSHVTLWVCGGLLYTLATLYSGKGVSTLLDVFDTPVKRLMIVGMFLLLSFVAHNVVKWLVMPKYTANK